MKPIFGLVLMLGLATVGCGNNECEDAADKMEECGVSGGEAEPSDDEISECNEDSECFAKCVNAASCSEIKASFNDGAMNDLTACVTKCISG